jgi:ACT domain-containing protein
MQPYKLSKVFDSEGNILTMEDAFRHYRIYNMRERIIKLNKENIENYSQVDNKDESQKHYDTLFEMDNIDVTIVDDATEKIKTQQGVHFDIVDDEIDEPIPEINIITPKVELDFDFKEKEPESSVNLEDDTPFEVAEIKEEQTVENVDALTQERFENLPPYDPRKELSLYQFLLKKITLFCLILFIYFLYSFVSLNCSLDYYLFMYFCDMFVEQIESICDLGT